VILAVASRDVERSTSAAAQLLFRADLTLTRSAYSKNYRRVGSASLSVVLQ